MSENSNQEGGQKTPDNCRKISDTPLPQVTVSHEVGGSLVEYKPLSPFKRGGQRSIIQQKFTPDISMTNRKNSFDNYMNRSLRSQSLTPTGCRCPKTRSNLVKAQVTCSKRSKTRSNSITLGSKECQNNICSNCSSAMSTTNNSGEDQQLESGSLEFREWMRSLRLHKYTERLLTLTYDEILDLKDDDLNKLEFTNGAKGKFLKQLVMIKNRPNKIREIKHQLEDIKELKDLLDVLPELEKLIMMPFKCNYKPIVPNQEQQKTSGFIKSKPTGAAINSLIERQSKRHDSGSDSGTDVSEEPPFNSACDVSQDLFDLLEKTFSSIICKQQDDSDRDRVVLHFFRLLERKCLKKEAFNEKQKQMFRTWLRRMDQVWDINNSDSDPKRKFERRNSHDVVVPLRRSSIQQPSAAGITNRSKGNPFIHPFYLSRSGGNNTSGGVVGNLPKSNNSLGAIGNKSGLSAQPPPSQGPPVFINDTRLTTPSPTTSSQFEGQYSLHPNSAVELSSSMLPNSIQRRSVPDINAGNLATPQINKRNSYQGDLLKMPLLVDLEVLTELYEIQTLGMDNNIGNLPSASSNKGISPSSTTATIGISPSPSSSTIGISPSPSSSGIYDLSYSSSNTSRKASTLSISSWDSGFSRRNSTLSSMCDDTSRRNSSIVDESNRSDLLGLPNSVSRRHSEMSNDGSFLSVDSAATGRVPQAQLGQNISTSSSYEPLKFITPGSLSSGCASDEGSTDDMENLHNVTMSVTQKALFE